MQKSPESLHFIVPSQDDNDHSTRPKRTTRCFRRRCNKSFSPLRDIEYGTVPTWRCACTSHIGNISRPPDDSIYWPGCSVEGATAVPQVCAIAPRTTRAPPM